MKDDLFQFVYDFMKDNNITCEEEFYQSDYIRLQLEEFASECWNIIKESYLKV